MSVLRDFDNNILNVGANVVFASRTAPDELCKGEVLELIHEHEYLKLKVYNEYIKDYYVEVIPANKVYCMNTASKPKGIGKGRTLFD